MFLYISPHGHHGPPLRVSFPLALSGGRGDGWAGGDIKSSPLQGTALQQPRVSTLGRFLYGHVSVHLAVRTPRSAPAGFLHPGPFRGERGWLGGRGYQVESPSGDGFTAAQGFNPGQSSADSCPGMFPYISPYGHHGPPLRVSFPLALSGGRGDGWGGRGYQVESPSGDGFAAAQGFNPGPILVRACFRTSRRTDTTVRPCGSPSLWPFPGEERMAGMRGDIKSSPLQGTALQQPRVSTLGNPAPHLTARTHPAVALHPPHGFTIFNSATTGRWSDGKRPSY